MEKKQNNKMVDLDVIIYWFKKEYELAYVNPFIKKPLSWALYSCWRMCDAIEKERTMVCDDL